MFWRYVSIWIISLCSMLVRHNRFWSSGFIQLHDSFAECGVSLCRGPLNKDTSQTVYLSSWESALKLWTTIVNMSFSTWITLLNDLPAQYILVIKVCPAPWQLCCVWGCRYIGSTIQHITPNILVILNIRSKIVYNCCHHVSICCWWCHPPTGVCIGFRGGGDFAYKFVSLAVTHRTEYWTLANTGSNTGSNIGRNSQQWLTAGVL